MNNDFYFGITLALLSVAVCGWLCWLAGYCRGCKKGKAAMLSYFKDRLKVRSPFIPDRKVYAGLDSFMEATRNPDGMRLQPIKPESHLARQVGSLGEERRGS